MWNKELLGLRQISGVVPLYLVFMIGSMFLVYAHDCLQPVHRSSHKCLISRLDYEEVLSFAKRAGYLDTLHAYKL